MINYAKLRVLMRENHDTYDTLFKKYGISRVTDKYPTTETLNKLCRLYKVQPNELFSFEESRKKEYLANEVTYHGIEELLVKYNQNKVEMAKYLGKSKNSIQELLRENKPEKCSYEFLQDIGLKYNVTTDSLWEVKK